AHGTSTPLGDTAEMSAIKRFLAGRSCGFAPVTGSVKGNVGHLLSAAGAVSLAKAALALERKVLPPTAGYLSPAPGLDLASDPEVRILTAPESWPEPSQGRPRVAAVNAFGFGGVNAQAVLEEYRPKDWADPLAVAKKKGKKPTGPPAAMAQMPGLGGRKEISALLVSARTVLAPWPNYEALARYWLTPEEPPMAHTRRFGGLKTTGYFFDSLSLNVKNFHLPPKELANALPQQLLAFKASKAAVAAAGLDPDCWPDSINRDKFGVFMGVEIDPRSADYALRWLGPSRAALALEGKGIDPKDLAELMEAMRQGAPPALTHSRVLGALGSFVASRLARFLGVGGPAFTMSEEQDSGLRALREAINMLQEGEIDLALVGVVDTFGDPKTASLAPKTVWVEGAAAMILASPKAASSLRPLARLTISEGSDRLGPLSGLFSLNRSGFYLRHHLKPLGRGHGFAYWLKNPDDPERSLEGPGYKVVEMPGARPQPLSVPTDPVKPDVWFLIRGDTEADAKESLALLAAMAEENSGRELFSLAKSHVDRSRPGAPKMALLARDYRELANLLKRVQAGEVDRDFRPRIIKAPHVPLQGNLAWVFPGSGNHYKGLGRGLAVSFPEIVSSLENESKNPIGLFQGQLFWEPNHKRPTVREAILGQVCFGLIGARLLEKVGIMPNAALGYSLGEVSALVATGIWPGRDDLYRDLMGSTLFNGDLTGELLAPKAYWNWPAHKPLKWLTAIIPRSQEQAREALFSLPQPHRQRAYILLVNTREEIVAGGEENAVQALAQALEAPLIPIEDVAAVHAAVVGPALAEYASFHTRPTAPRPDIKFYSSALAKAITQDTKAIAESMAAQAIEGHVFPDLIERAYADGIRFFVEIGPGNSTTRMIRSILGERPHLAQTLAATAVEEGWTGLSRLVVELWLSGYPVSPETTLLQPPPEPDPRYEIPIGLSPPEVNWPCPNIPIENGPETKGPPASPEDYLAWLERQTRPLASPEADPEPAPMASGASPSAKAQPGPANSAQESPTPTSAPAQGKANGQANELPTASRAGQSPATSQVPPPRRAKDKDALDREACMEFAIGTIAKSLGPQYATIDTFPSRVRLPDEPLMFVDRVTLMEGQPLSLSKGRVVTEHDLREGEWCLEGGYLTPGMSIESGQADLLLSAYLGADFSTKGLANYRLLDAEVAFHSDPPRVGQTATYDIRINNFFSHADTLMFRFEFDGSVSGKPLLSMRRGCAGFFTPKALAAGKGLGRSQPMSAQELSEAAKKPGQDGPSQAPAEYRAGIVLGPFMDPAVTSLDSQALAALRAGQAGPLGPAIAKIAPKGSPLLPGGKLALIARATEINQLGGVYGAGLVRAEADIDPEAWYLVSHFKGDEVMPGTLMYDASLQALRLLLLARGWLGPSGEACFLPPLGLAQSLKCRGQVTPATKVVSYEVHLREAGLWQPPFGHLDQDSPEGPSKRHGRPAKQTRGKPSLDPEAAPPEPYAIAEAIMLADGRPIVEVHNLGLRLTGLDPEILAKFLPGSRKRLASRATQAAPPAAESTLAGEAQAQAPKTVRRAAKRQTKIAEADSPSFAETPETGEQKVAPGPLDPPAKDAEPPTPAAPGSLAGSSPSPSRAQVSVRRPVRALDIFDKERLTIMSTGILSEALGPLYARFDHGGFVARLPQAPYDFIDKAVIKKGQLGLVSLGTQVEATYDLEASPQARDWLLSQAGGTTPVVPYAAINEMALQSCGFLAAYMGSALTFPGPMRFRNLGGEAILHKHIDKLEGQVSTRASLTKSSVLGAMTIQHYQFAVTHNGQPLY
ncbi:MAG: hypothetical protein LBU69_02005, partial [Deltaproteobacteria bacterium]|nr:hypothetical protein [Deltaproteobacteria bacterium]